MKVTTRSKPVLALLALVSILSISGPPAALAAETPAAKVVGLLGLAQYSRAGGGQAAIKIGTMLQPGDIVQTANGSALDLDCGKDLGTLRLLQSTTLTLKALTATSIQIDMKGGEILSRVKKLPEGGKFEVQVPNGIAGVIEGEYRLDSRGYLVLLDGSAVFVQLRDGAEPVAHTLKSKDPVYYSPVEQEVRPAPKALEKEVKQQLKARLPRK